MKKSISLFTVCLAVQWISSCAPRPVQTPASVRTVAADNAALLTTGPLWGAMYQQKAAEYKALALQAYNIARERLDEYLENDHQGRPLAIISDIDETILDNSPNTVHNSIGGHTYSDSSWVTWTKKATADTVPGAPSFFKYAAGRGVEVFYISNRMAEEMQQTAANLQAYGMPNADAAHLLLKTTTSSKNARRAAVASSFEVVLYIGDNLGDYLGDFDKKSVDARASLVQQHAADFGRRFIVLPNTMYGEWVSALYHHQHSLNNAAKADTMTKLLNTY